MTIEAVVAELVEIRRVLAVLEFPDTEPDPDPDPDPRWPDDRRMADACLLCGAKALRSGPNNRSGTMAHNALTDVFGNWGWCGAIEFVWRRMLTQRAISLASQLGHAGEFYE